MEPALWDYDAKVLTIWNVCLSAHTYQVPDFASDLKDKTGKSMPPGKKDLLELPWCSLLVGKRCMLVLRVDADDDQKNPQLRYKFLMSRISVFSKGPARSQDDEVIN